MITINKKDTIEETIEKIDTEMDRLIKFFDSIAFPNAKIEFEYLQQLKHRLENLMDNNLTKNK